MLRMPDGMRDKIRIAAEQSGRSMNSEIVARLADSFKFGDREHQAFLGHIERVEAFIQASPSRRDKLVIALLEQYRLIESFTETMRQILEEEP